MLEKDRTYWNSFRNGDRDALYYIYERFYNFLYKEGIKIYYDPDLVKDLIHFLFLDFWEKRERLPDVDNLHGYIYSSFRRKLIRTLSHKSFSSTIELDENHQDILTVQSYENEFILHQEESLKRQKLASLLEQLPPRQKELIIMKYYDALSYEEIAKITNLSIQSVYNQVNTAIKFFRKKTQNKK